MKEIPSMAAKPVKKRPKKAKTHTPKPAPVRPVTLDLAEQASYDLEPHWGPD